MDFYIYLYFFGPFLPPSYFSLPLFATLAAVSKLGKAGFAIGVQLLPHGSNCGVNPVLLQLAFPHDDDAPAERFQEGVILQVALAVVLYLCSPELRVRLRPRRITAILVTVPEASVPENARAVLGQDDVGGSGESLLVDAITVSEPEQFLAQLHFRLGAS